VRHDRATVVADGTDTVVVCEAIARLDPRQRAAVVLRYYQGFDYATIASILQTSSGNVGALLSRALVRLRTELDSTVPTPMTAISTTGEVGHGR
jgi:DNA-directed RNA polymerase specialized sigma24 family protein